MRGYRLNWVVFVILLIIAIPLISNTVYSATYTKLATPKVIVSVDSISPKIPCKTLSVPIKLTPIVKGTIVISILPPYDKYLIPSEKTLTLIEPTEITINGIFPCSSSGMQNAQLLIKTLSGEIVATKQLTIPLQANYAFSLLQKEKLKGCSEETLTKKLLLKNKGNVPNVYTITANSGKIKPTKIAILPKKEQIILLTHTPEESNSATLTIQTAYGNKKYSYPLVWETRKCINLQLEVPHEILACRTNEKEVSYSVLNNGTDKEEITIVIPPEIGDNETITISPGKTLNKTLKFVIKDIDEYKYGKESAISIYAKNKLILKDHIHLEVLDQNLCSKLDITEVLHPSEGKLILKVQNKGIEKGVYSFEIESPDELKLETKSLILMPGGFGEINFNYQNLTENELVLQATAGNYTQPLRAYISKEEPLIDWTSANDYTDKYGYIIAGIIGLLMLIIIVGLYYFTKTEEEFDLQTAKPSWFERRNYNQINFDNIFEEEKQTYPEIKPTTPFNWKIPLLIFGILLLIGGSYGVLSIFPENGKWIIGIVGGVIFTLGIIGLIIVYILKKLNRQILKWRMFGSWSKIIVFLFILAVITLAIYNRPLLTVYYENNMANETIDTNTKTINPNNETTQNPVVEKINEHLNQTELDLGLEIDYTTDNAIFIIGSIIVMILFVSLANKLYKSIKQRNKEKEENEKIEQLAKKIVEVEEKTRALKEGFAPTNKKAIWQQFVDFFFEDVPDDFADGNAKPNDNYFGKEIGIESFEESGPKSKSKANKKKGKSNKTKSIYSKKNKQKNK